MEPLFTRVDMEKLIATGMQPALESLKRIETNIASLTISAQNNGICDPRTRTPLGTPVPISTPCTTVLSPNIVGGIEKDVVAQSDATLAEINPKLSNLEGSSAKPLDAANNEFASSLTMERIAGRTAKKPGLLKRCVQKIKKLSEFWQSLTEPKRDHLLGRFVASASFENFCSAVILLNTMWVAYSSDWEMKNRGRKAPSIMSQIEVGFIAFYTIELLLKMIVHRFYFFINHDMSWNIFDLVLVTLAVVNWCLEKLTEGGGGAGNVSFMRMLRLLKLSKILRTLRVMHVFKDLSLIMESFRNSIVSLFWSLVMMFFVIYIFSLVFLQAANSYLVENDGHVDAEQEAQLVKHFGSMADSAVSLYMAVTGGNDWSLYYEVLANAGQLNGIIFLLFIFFYAFALLNILQGVFVEKAVIAATPDREEVIMEQHAKNQADVNEFSHICEILDADNTGTLTREEFAETMGNPLMKDYMEASGLCIRDMRLFFEMIAEGKDVISINSFVHGCMRMKGAATSFDVQVALERIRQLGKECLHIEQECSSLRFVMQDVAAHVYSLHNDNTAKIKRASLPL